MVDSSVKVSVIVPMDRPGPDALRAIESVLSQKTRHRFELVIVGATAEGLPADARVRFAAAPDRNPAIRRNLGAGQARGEILAFLDDDAFAEPGWIERAVGWLDEHPGVVALGGPDPAPEDSGPAELISDTLLATRWIGSGIAAHQARPGIFAVKRPWDVALVNLFVRRSAFEEAGGFDESIGYIGEDTDLLRRLARKGIVLYHEGVLVRHRRRRYPGPYLRQRWRYRVKTGERLVRGGGYWTPQVAVFLAAGAAFLLAIALVPAFALGMLVVYALLTTALAIPATRLRARWWPLLPVAFLAHHAVYWCGMVAGMVRGMLGR